MTWIERLVCWLALLGIVALSVDQDYTIQKQRVELRSQLQTMENAQSKQLACQQELGRLKK